MTVALRGIRYVVVASVCGLVGASCSDMAGPDSVPVGATGLAVVEQPLAQGQRSLRVAQIATGSESNIVVPATVRAGEAVSLLVTTYGDGCTREDKTEVKVVGSEADVVPYQMIYSPKADEACDAILLVTQRAVSLLFASVGTVTVTITGRLQPDSGIVRVVSRVVVE